MRAIRGSSQTPCRDAYGYNDIDYIYETNVKNFQDLKILIHYRSTIGKKISGQDKIHFYLDFNWKVVLMQYLSNRIAHNSLHIFFLEVCSISFELFYDMSNNCLEE